MGIHKLMNLIQEKAPGSIKQVQLETLMGRIVACDAPMAMYQFLIATQGMNQQSGLTELTDKEGNRTAHLVGLLNRTIQFLESGIKPIWVFDGKPPTLKNGEVARRKKIKEEAKVKFQEAEEAGDLEQALKAKVLTTSISSKMIDDCKRMLRLAGVPVVEAPSEAEAQCSAMVKAGKAYATATEDMDALTFGSTVLLRGFNNKKEPIYEIHLPTVLKELEMTYEEFIDLCILCGSDYTEWIDGIGPVTAFKLMKDHKNLEGVIKKFESDNKSGTRKKPWHIPDPYPYPEVREFFKDPEVTKDMSTLEIKWEKPNEEELTKFLVEEKGFSEIRVANAIKKLKSIDTKGTQSRLDSFFGAGKKVTSTTPRESATKKETKKPKLARGKK